MAVLSLVGLDIGSTSVRAVETSRGKDGAVVTAFGAIALPAGAVLAGSVQDETAVTVALKELWATARFHGRKVALGITNPQIVVRKMSLTNLSPAQLRKTLPFQVRDSLPLPVERSLLDFYPLERSDGETVDGLLIASPKEAVLSAIRAIERAGLHVASVDLASFALLRSTSRLDATVEAIVDIGAQVTTVIAHSDGVPLIVRTVPRGGVEITETIASRLNIDSAQAEQRKRDTGMDAEADPDIAAVVREAVRPLINEIRSSFAYLSTGDRNARVTRMVVAGGGAYLPGLIEALAEQLSIEVVLADPLIRFTKPRSIPEGLRRLGTTVAVPLGLTLGAA